MRRMVAALLTLTLLVCCGGACAEGELTVSSKAVIVRSGDDYGMFAARVENTGDEPVYYDNGNLIIFTEKGDVLISEYIVGSAPGGILLNPGEYAYCHKFLWSSALKDAKFGDIRFVVTSDSKGNRYGQLPATAELDLSGSGTPPSNFAFVTVTNITDDVLFGVYIVTALLDKEGNVIYAEPHWYDALGIHPGSTVTERILLDRACMEYYEVNGIELGAVDVLAYYRLKEDQGE